jgi:hypothetical protein
MQLIRKFRHKSLRFVKRLQAESNIFYQLPHAGLEQGPEQSLTFLFMIQHECNDQQLRHPVERRGPFGCRHFLPFLPTGEGTRKGMREDSTPAKSSLAFVANSAHMPEIEFRLTGLRQHFLSALDLSLTSKISIGRAA